MPEPRELGVEVETTPPPESAPYHTVGEVPVANWTYTVSLEESPVIFCKVRVAVELVALTVPEESLILRELEETTGLVLLKRKPLEVELVVLKIASLSLMVRRTWALAE